VGEGLSAIPFKGSFTYSNLVSKSEKEKEEKGDGEEEWEVVA